MVLYCQIIQKKVSGLKATGNVRIMDKMGRIVIPMELRRLLDVGEGDALEIFSEDNMIILRKYLPSCIFCGNSRDVSTFKGHNVCPACVREIGLKFE